MKLHYFYHHIDVLRGISWFYWWWDKNYNFCDNFATVTSIIRGNEEVTLFKRRIEHDLIVKSLAIFI